jgi:hypothetical protein
MSPVSVVPSVSVGVVVGVATEPVRPFAETTDIVVTVPHELGFVYLTPRGCVESATSICQSVHTGRRVFAVALRTTISPFVVRTLSCAIL